MAFVRSQPQVGDVKILKHDITCMKGTILAGSRVVITGHSYRGWDIKDLESGEEVSETIGFDIFQD